MHKIMYIYTYVHICTYKYICVCIIRLLMTKDLAQCLVCGKHLNDCGDTCLEER